MSTPALMTIDEARRRADPLEGWLDPAEGPLLFELARQCTGRGVIVEIGSWKGKSTTWLASGVQAADRTTKVIAIDPHTGSPEHQAGDQKVWTFDEFSANIKATGVDSHVSPIVAFSVDAARTFDQKVELIFIDGAHEYEAVKEDIAAWLPHMLEGGTVAFHDSDWPGVAQALKEDVYHGRRFFNVRRIGEITYATVTAHNTPAQRFENAMRFRARKTRDVIYAQREKIPAPLHKIGRPIMQAIERLTKSA